MLSKAFLKIKLLSESDKRVKEKPYRKYLRSRYEIMRKALSPYMGKYVLCRGWITDWEDLPNNTRRFYVSQPTIRKPDKSKLFQDQERITTEHHLNLFISKEDLDSYGMEFGMNLPINFSGTVERYTRKNGTEDYGIYPTIDSTLHTKLNLVAAITEKLSERPTYTPQEYLWARSLDPIMKVLGEQLESAGDELPTFDSTYEDYKLELEMWEIAGTKMTEHIRSICSNRRFRRRNKIKGNFAKMLDRYARKPDDVVRYLTT